MKKTETKKIVSTIKNQGFVVRQCSRLYRFNMETSTLVRANLSYKHFEMMLDFGLLVCPFDRVYVLSKKAVQCNNILKFRNK